MFKRGSHSTVRKAASGIVATLLVGIGLLALPGVANAVESKVDTYRAHIEAVPQGGMGVGAPVNWAVQDSVGGNLPECSAITSYALSGIIENPIQLKYVEIKENSVTLGGAPLDPSEYGVTTSSNSGPDGPIDTVTVTLTAAGIAKVNEDPGTSLAFTFVTTVLSVEGGTFYTDATATIGYTIDCPTPPLTPVEALAPTLQSDAPCDEEAGVILPQVKGLTYAIASRNGNQVTVTATVDEGYEVAPGTKLTWMLTIPDIVPCAGLVDPPTEPTKPPTEPTEPTEPTQAPQKLAKTGASGTATLSLIATALLATGAGFLLRSRLQAKR